MIKLGRFTQILGVLLFALALAACGGGGGGGGDDGGDNGGGEEGTTYSGSISEATVDDTNSDDVGRASAEGTLASLRQEQAQDASPLATGTLSEETIANIHVDVIREARTAVLSRTVSPQATSTVNGDCGGTATVDTNSSQGGDVVTGYVAYNDYCLSAGTADTVIFNGTVDYEIRTDSGGDLSYYRFTYNNFRFTSNGETQSVTAEVECTFSGTSASCTTSSDFVGSDGRTYRTVDYTVSGDASTGYDVSARVYDPDHGYVDIVATNITVCANGNIGTGTITVTDSTGTDVMTVTFTSCSEYTVTYNGVTDTYTW